MRIYLPEGELENDAEDKERTDSNCESQRFMLIYYDCNAEV